MSRRSTIVVATLAAVATLATVLAPVRGAAQTQPADPLSTAAASTAAAYARWQAAVAANRAHVLQRGELPVVAVVGTLAIHADTPGVPARAIAALDSAVREARVTARSVVGAVADSVLAGTPLYTEVARVGGGIEVRIGSREPGGQAYHHTSAAHPDFSRLVQSLLAYVESGAGARAAALRPWVRSPIQIEPYPALAYEGFYLMLAVTPSASGRACIEGVLGACRTALGLFDTPDSLGAWFTPQQRMTLALAATEDSTAQSDERDACRRADDAACRALLSRVGVRAPAGALARRALVRLALAKGGEGAFNRLIAAESSTVVGRLEAAARLPVDSLLAEWRRDVLRGQPSPPAPTPVELLGCVAVGVLALAASAGRRP